MSTTTESIDALADLGDLRENQRRWIEALERGGYQQGHGLLRVQGDDEDRFCCLGVLVETLRPDEWVAPSKGMTAYSVKAYPIEDNLSENIAVLPTRLRALVGLTNDQSQELINLNDTLRVDFAGIATQLRAWFAIVRETT